MTEFIFAPGFTLDLKELGEIWSMVYDADTRHTGVELKNLTEDSAGCWALGFFFSVTLIWDLIVI